MCENPDSRTTLRKLEERLLIETQRGMGELIVDDNYAYLRGKAIQKDVWGRQAFDAGLPADIYLEIAALARNEAGSHIVKYKGNEYLVEVNGIVLSARGQHRKVISIKLHQI